MKKKYNKIKNNTSITSSLKNNIKNYLKITSTDKLYSDITSSENIGKNIRNEDHSEYMQTNVPENTVQLKMDNTQLFSTDQISSRREAVSGIIILTNHS